MHGLDVIADDGIDFVFNTPNDKSRPGYLKMGWQEVGRLPVAIKLASPAAVLTVARSRVAASHWPIDIGIGEPAAVGLERLEFTSVADDVRSLVTSRSGAFMRWRYASPFLGYRVVEGGGQRCVARVRRRSQATELVVLDGVESDRAPAGAPADVLSAAGATHALRLGAPNLRSGFVAVPGGGPMLTFRSVQGGATPPIANWGLTMGDVELF
jgi:hypothetical protein